MMNSLSLSASNVSPILAVAAATVPLYVEEIQTKSPAETDTEVAPEFPEVAVSDMVNVTAVSLPPILMVKVRLCPAPGATESRA
jgi:hypothetical protein